MLYWHPVQLNLSALCFSLRLASLTSFSSAVSWALACLSRSLLIRSLSCLLSLSGFILCNFFLSLVQNTIRIQEIGKDRVCKNRLSGRVLRTITYIHTEKLSTEVTKIGLATLAPNTNMYTLSSCKAFCGALLNTERVHKAFCCGALLNTERAH